MALMFMPFIATSAQDNSWEQPEPGKTATNPDAKYLAGAVPEVDGKVVFSTTIKAPGKTKEQIFSAESAEASSYRPIRSAAETMASK